MTAHHHSADDAAANFARRHIGPSPRDVEAMLGTVGATSLGALMAETLPAAIRQTSPLDLGAPLSETEALAHMRDLAAQSVGWAKAAPTYRLIRVATSAVPTSHVAVGTAEQALCPTSTARPPLPTLRAEFDLPARTP